MRTRTAIKNPINRTGLEKIPLHQVVDRSRYILKFPFQDWKNCQRMDSLHQVVDRSPWPGLSSKSLRRVNWFDLCIVDVHCIDICTELRDFWSSRFELILGPPICPFRRAICHQMNNRYDMSDAAVYALELMEILEEEDANVVAISATLV
jgi:hypothetical protein